MEHLKAIVLVLLILSMPTFGRAQESVPLTPPGVSPRIWGALRMPADPGPHPGVILLPGSSGWRPEYTGVADPYAQAGFVVLALDYYAETGGAPVGSEEKLQKWESWRRTVQEAGAFLQGLPSVAGRRLALVGYSRGGFLAVSVAASMPSVAAVVDFYGGGGGGTLTLEEEVQGLPPLLIIHGERDSVVPVSFAEALRAAALAAGGQVEAHLLPNADHAFNAPWSPTYSRESDEESFQWATVFLQAHLGTDPELSGGCAGTDPSVVRVGPDPSGGHVGPAATDVHREQ